MQLKKNINLGKNNFLLILLILSLFFSVAKSETVNDEKFVEIKILDKTGIVFFFSSNPEGNRQYHLWKSRK